MSSSHALWYAARGTGVSALVLFTATVALGVAALSRMTGTRWPRFLTQGLHRNLSLLSVVFLVVHIASSVLDTYVHLSVADAVVPFFAGYRPLWVGLGTVAFDLVVALVVTSLLRARLGYRAWRAVHWLAYAAWPVALLHGLGAGTDARTPWMLALTGLCVGVVAVAVGVRLLVTHSGPGDTPAPTRPTPGRQLVGAVAGGRTSRIGQ